MQAQLKKAVDEDASVIGTIVELLQDALGGARGGGAQDIAETLRTLAATDLATQLRIRDAGGVRPLMAALAQTQKQESG